MAFTIDIPIIAGCFAAWGSSLTKFEYVSVMIGVRFEYGFIPNY